MSEHNSGPELKEQSLFQKLLGMIFVGDVRSAIRSSFTGVVGPKINDLIAMTLKYIIDGIFKGNQAATPQQPQDSRITSTLFSQYWTGVGGQTVPKVKPADVTRPMSQDIWFPTKIEADETLAYMIGICAREGQCNVNQLFDKVGLTVPATSVDWGWRDFAAKAKVVPGKNGRGQDGYILHTAHPIYLK